MVSRGRPDLAIAARKRAVELRAIRHGAATDVERECLEAVFAYEQVLSAKNGKRTRASRTWPMIERHGILEAVARAVNRKEETAGYTALLDTGLEGYSFEAVVLRHSSHFAAEVVRRSKERVNARSVT